MRSRKTMPRRKMSRARHAAVGMRATAFAESEESDQSRLDPRDEDSVPQPIEEWSDDDEADRWLHEHRFDGGEPFDIH